MASGAVEAVCITDAGLLNSANLECSRTARGPGVATQVLPKRGLDMQLDWCFHVDNAASEGNTTTAGVNGRLFGLVR